MLAEVQVSIIIRDEIYSKFSIEFNDDPDSTEEEEGMNIHRSSDLYSALHTICFSLNTPHTKVGNLLTPVDKPQPVYRGD
jgi:hypothetical protein